MLKDKTDFRIVFIVSLCLIAAIIVSYLQVIHFDFVGYDDELYVTKNLYVQKGISLEGIKWAFMTFHAANWHPLTWLSHMLDCELYGLDPSGHHWTNVVFHIANTLLLFFSSYIKKNVFIVNQSLPFRQNIINLYFGHCRKPYLR